MSTEPARPPSPVQAQFTIQQAGVHGWYVSHAGTVIACFENAAGLARWLERELSAFEPVHKVTGNDPLPNVLANDDDPAPAKRRWFG